MASYLSSEAKNKECAEKNKSRSCEEKAKIECSIVGSLLHNTNFLPRIKYLFIINFHPTLLSCIMNMAGKRFLPSIHLDHLHPIHNLIHQPDPLVCLPSCSHPQLPKLFPHPGCTYQG